MCGIVGYTGKRSAADILIEGLRNLEYRGYDSAGIALFGQDGITTIKTKGRMDDLDTKVTAQKPESGCGIGHTRWATHGEPSDVNAHPHNTPRVSMVHNGIIENYVAIKAFLADKGVTFVSQTDTEAAVRLVDYFYDGDPVAAILKARAMLEGSYAFGILFADHPGEIYCLRKDSPLLIALGEGENFIASDMPAMLNHTRRYYLLEEGEVGIVTPDTVRVVDANGNPVVKEEQLATWNVEQAQKGGYPHFMLKEIFEQPAALHATMSPRVVRGLPSFAESGIPDELFDGVTKINIVACGTAMHAGLLGKAFFEGIARMPVEVEVASEFRYRNPVLTQGQLAVIISQSGETADSLAALRLCKSAGIPVVAIVNVAGSSIAREADYCIYTYAGPEIAVASTKAYSVQVNLMYLLSLTCALRRGAISQEQAKGYMTGLAKAVALTPLVLELAPAIKEYAEGHLTDAEDLFYIGRGFDYALAMEGSLKLKEISYIHSEACAAGELKHGTIALISRGTPVIALATQSALIPKMESNIKEIKARGGKVLLITAEGFEIDPSCCDQIIRLPAIDDLFMPVLAVIVLQLVAYYASTARGCDVDKPRNLAKSVTVE